MKLQVSSLETNVVEHCINSCVGCNHFSPICDKYFLDGDTLRHDLDRLSCIMHADKFSFLGGEPLLHPDLIELVAIARMSGIADIYSVTTNGQLLSHIPNDLWKSFDSMIVDVYPGKLSAADVDGIRQKANRFGVALTVSNVTSFYKCLTRDDSTDSVTAARFDLCMYKDLCYTVDRGFLYRCPQSIFIPKLFLGLPREADGIAVDSLDYDGLVSFLRSPAPLASCRRCSNNEAWTGWREVPRRQWLDESMT